MATAKRTRVKAPTLNPSSESVLATNINDVITLKPHGRVCTERGGTRKENLLKCKQSMFVSTLNTRTLRSIYLQEELCGLAKRFIIGLQEHKIVHPDEPIRYHDLFDGYQLVSSSAWRNRAGMAVGGVGILMSAKAKKTILSCICITPRIICATFGGSPKTTIIVTYCPTNVSDEKESEEHYMLLDKSIKQVPAHNFLMVMGDFNARVGKEHYKVPYHDSTNRNGELLHTLAIENELEIANEVRNSILNCCTYNSFASVGSDHRVITAKVRLSLRSNGKTPPRKIRYNWKVLAQDTQLQELYAVKVRNIFSALQHESEGDEDATSTYQCFIPANREVTEELIPKAPKRHKGTIWTDSRTESARNEVHEAYVKDTHECTSVSRSELQARKNLLKEAYDKINQGILEQKISQVEKADQNCQHKASWDLINEISGRRTAKKGQIKGDTESERLHSWFSHFQQLLGNPPVITNEDEPIEQVHREFDMRTDAFDQEEYEAATKVINEGKSAGDDEITPEVLKRCNLDDIILYFCNEALLHGRKPEQWSILNLIPIPKSGNLREGRNYRVICLSSIVAKTYNRLLLNRIRPFLDPVLRMNQNGQQCHKYWP
ncbi:uncharacterized protein [Amphiura filiformis]|uniref:uncharacterized protein n=1 Tax=Amphiura filiformis TaxID=82378 RepID=UPI003B22348C